MSYRSVRYQTMQSVQLCSFISSKCAKKEHTNNQTVKWSNQQTSVTRAAIQLFQWYSFISSQGAKRNMKTIRKSDGTVKHSNSRIVWEPDNQTIRQSNTRTLNTLTHRRKQCQASHFKIVVLDKTRWGTTILWMEKWSYLLTTPFLRNTHMHKHIVEWFYDGNPRFQNEFSIICKTPNTNH